MRPAHSGDLAALIRIEDDVFQSDRISRRSFRRFLEPGGARLIVAENKDGICGYALLLIRRGTALARLYSLAVAPEYAGRGIGRRLLTAAEEAAFEAERIVLRLEVRADNQSALQLYKTSGYRDCGIVPDYYEDGCTAVRMQKLLHGPVLGAGRAPYYSQTTDFTCGPACVLMALQHFDPALEPGTLDEVTLWREATTVFLAAGHGGCGPFGLANALARRGLAAEVRLLPEAPLFLSTVRDPEKRRILELVQLGYRSEAGVLGVRRSNAPLDAAGLAETVRQGTLAIVLISGYRMFGKREPHWILVHDADSRHLVIHDPWLEHEQHESPADAANLPIPFNEFDRMARWGRTGVRAQILISKEN